MKTEILGFTVKQIIMTAAIFTLSMVLYDKVVKPYVFKA
jgi:hypothetical protein